MKTDGNIKLEPKINFKTFFVDLDEIPDQIDISINLPPKNVPEVPKPALKPKNTIALF